MKKIWVKKFKSFEEAEEADKKYYANMSPEERLATMQFIRESYFKMVGIKHDGRKRLRRVFKIVKQK